MSVLVSVDHSIFKEAVKSNPRHRVGLNALNRFEPCIAHQFKISLNYSFRLINKGSAGYWLVCLMSARKRLVGQNFVTFCYRCPASDAKWRLLSWLEGIRDITIGWVFEGMRPPLEWFFEGLIWGANTVLTCDECLYLLSII